MIKRGKDKFSSKYEREVLRSKRYEKGQFFTHKEIVEFIINSIPIKKDWKYLDPTCGAGAFLSSLIKKGVPVKNLSGVDIDQTPLELCKESLKELSTNKKFNLKLGDIIRDNLFEEKTFNVIIGNPPFQTLSQKKERVNSLHPLYKEVIRGPINSATLVVVRAYSLLKEGGYLAFVLPKNVLRVDSFRALREFLLKNTKLLMIYDLDHHFKDVRGDQIILIFQKEKLSREEMTTHQVKLVAYRKNLPFGKGEAFSLSQSNFFDYDFFPLFFNKEVANISKKMLRIKKTLKDFSEIFRGISIGAKNPFLSEEYQKGMIRIFRGDSIKKFGIKYPLFIDPSKLNESEQKKLKRTYKKKLIIQNLFSKEGGITATLSKENESSMATVTNVIPHNKKDLLFLLGLINSDVANFFMIFVIYLNSNFTMHTDASYLGKFPIIIPHPRMRKQIESIVLKLLEFNNTSSEDFRSLYKELNTLIFELYNLTENEKIIISDSLDLMMSKKQREK